LDFLSKAEIFCAKIGKMGKISDPNLQPHKIKQHFRLKFCEKAAHELSTVPLASKWTARPSSGATTAGVDTINAFRQGCQMVYFQTKNRSLGKFFGPWNGKCCYI
jgi:hypothetical protein